jgi:hypothetical protein
MKFSLQHNSVLISSSTTVVAPYSTLDSKKIHFCHRIMAVSCIAVQPELFQHAGQFLAIPDTPQVYKQVNILTYLQSGSCSLNTTIARNGSALTLAARETERFKLLRGSRRQEDRSIWRSEWTEGCEGRQECYEKRVLSCKDGDEGIY